MRPEMAKDWAMEAWRNRLLLDDLISREGYHVTHRRAGNKWRNPPSKPFIPGIGKERKK